MSKKNISINLFAAWGIGGRSVTISRIDQEIHKDPILASIYEYDIIFK